MKKLILSTFIATMMAGSAYAQSAIMANDPAHKAGDTMHNAINGAKNAVNSATKKINGAMDRAVQYVTPAQTDFVASSLINSNVQNMQGETIGEIKDVVIRDNQVEGIVIGVGGFLGMGERYVVIDPETIQMTNENDTWKIVTNATKDSLKAAPEFKYEGRWAL